MTVKSFPARIIVPALILYFNDPLYLHLKTFVTLHQIAIYPAINTSI
jgi:hypothetical protein